MTALTTLNTFDPLLPLYVAENLACDGIPLYSFEEIAKQFNISIERLDILREQPSFISAVRTATEEIKDSGSHVKRKASAQYEMYLDTIVPAWMSDPDFPPSDKVKLLQHLAKIGRIDNSDFDKAKAEMESGKSATFNIVLTTTLDPIKTITIEHEPDDK